ncbi:hypothetical protein [Acinetobacter baumannii]|uniref:hypothetical protein n=1 Tax=Acinetobacter baumannii TaxID=470 RepID=UPI00366F045B
MTDKVGSTFYVKSGSVYSGQVGYCTEQLSKEIKFKRGSDREDCVKLHLDGSGVETWFKLSEVNEVTI